MSNEFKINNGVEVVGSIEIGSGTTTNAVIQRRQTPAVSSGSGATIYSTIFAAGNGIGNTSPYTMRDDHGATIELRAGAPASDQYGGGIFINANGHTGALVNGNAIVFRNRTGTDTYTERMRIARDGNVGIGSTTPNAKLTVITAAGSNGLNVSDGSDSDFIVVPGVSSGVARVGPGAGQMAFYANGSEAMRIDNGTQVGINVTTVSAKFHLNGTIRIDSQAVTNPLGTNSGVPTNYYGAFGSNYLGEPSTWLTINLDGTDYFLAAYIAT